jgi:hypothetical protein
MEWSEGLFRYQYLATARLRPGKEKIWSVGHFMGYFSMHEAREREHLICGAFHGLFQHARGQRKRKFDLWGISWAISACTRPRKEKIWSVGHFMGYCDISHVVHCILAQLRPGCIMGTFPKTDPWLQCTFPYTFSNLSALHSGLLYFSWYKCIKFIHVRVNKLFVISNFLLEDVLQWGSTPRKKAMTKPCILMRTSPLVLASSPHNVALVSLGWKPWGSRWTCLRSRETFGFREEY